MPCAGPCVAGPACGTHACPSRCCLHGPAHAAYAGNLLHCVGAHCSVAVLQILGMIEAMPEEDAVAFVKAHVVPESYPTVSVTQAWQLVLQQQQRRGCCWDRSAACTVTLLPTDSLQ